MPPAVYAEVSALVSKNTGVALTKVDPVTLEEELIWYVPACWVVVVPATNKSIAGCKKVS